MSDDQLPEQPPRDPVDDWRKSQEKFMEEAKADYRRRNPPELQGAMVPLQPVMKAVARIINKELMALHAELRGELEVLAERLRREIDFKIEQSRKRRRKKMTRAEADRYVMSKRGLPKEMLE
jgi:hypothetical protein